MGRRACRYVEAGQTLAVEVGHGTIVRRRRTVPASTAAGLLTENAQRKYALRPGLPMSVVTGSACASGMAPDFKHWPGSRVQPSRRVRPHLD